MAKETLRWQWVTIMAPNYIPGPWNQQCNHKNHPPPSSQCWVVADTDSKFKMGNTWIQQIKKQYFEVKLSKTGCLLHLNFSQATNFGIDTSQKSQFLCCLVFAMYVKFRLNAAYPLFSFVLNLVAIHNPKIFDSRFKSKKKKNSFGQSEPGQR